MNPIILKRVEFAANLAILLSVALIGVRFLKPEWLRPGLQEVRVQRGAKFTAFPEDWAAHGRTLVIALQTGCRFCAESAPFYRRLAAAVQQSGKTHLVAALPQEPSVGKDYLRTMGIPIEDVRQTGLAAMKVPGTPTLMLVNGEGIVTSVWVGQLSVAEEAEVLAALART